MPNIPWVLAIDFGTTNTAAATRDEDGQVHVLQIDGQTVMSSVVYLDPDLGLVAGRAAEALAPGAPHRAIRSPKRRLVDPAPVVLDGRAFSATAVAASVLSHVLQRAIAALGSRPSEIVLTHPASWGRPQLDRFREAAGLAGFADPHLVPEPVAAATALSATTVVPSGGHLAVYDLGGGTFDTAIVRAMPVPTAGAPAFELVGRASGDANLGGELFDELIAARITAQLRPDDAEALATADDPLWQRAHAQLLTEARRVKEAMAHQRDVEVVVALPSGFVPVMLGRAEIDAALEPSLAKSADAMVRCLADNGLDAGRLHGVFLVGGCSHMPRVQTIVRDRFPTVPILTVRDPKTVVAMGALSAALAPGSTEERAPNGRGSTETPAERGTTTPGPTTPVAPTTRPGLTTPVAPPANPGPTTPVAPPMPVALPPPPSSQPSPPPLIEAPAGLAPSAPPWQHEPTTEPRRNRRGLVVFIGALIAALIVGAFALTRNRSDETATADTATVSGDSQSVGSAVDPDAPRPTDFGSPVWSADGSVLARTYSDDTVKLWNPRTGEELCTIEGTSVAISPDATKVATTTDANVVRIWSTSGDELDTIESARGYAWAPDGKRVAVLRDDGSVGVGPAEGGEDTRTIAQPTPRITAIGWSSDSARLLVRDVDLSYVWDPDDPEAIHELDGALSFGDITWSPDGALLAGVIEDGHLRIWNPDTGTPVVTSNEKIRVVWWSPDSKLIAAKGEFDGASTRIVDAATLSQDLASDDQGSAFAWSPDGARFVLGRFDGSAHVFDTADHTEIVELNTQGAPLSTLLWSGAGDLIATEGDGVIRIWDAASGEIVSTPTG